MMALKGGHCSETRGKESEGPLEGLFAVKIRRGCSAGVPRLHVSRHSTHGRLEGSARPHGNQRADEMSSGRKGSP